MGFRRVIVLVALAALFLHLLPGHVAAQTEWPNCENFLDQDDAQATYDADRANPFDLESAEPVNDVPCEDEPNFGTQPLVSCDALREYPTAQQALQGLYDHTRIEGDPYGLDQGGDPAMACDGGDGGGDEEEALDGPPPERGRTDEEVLDGPAPGRSRDDQAEGDAAPPATRTDTSVSVNAVALNDFASLEARLEARFAALEAEFAAFELRAQDGFGRFAEADDDEPVDQSEPAGVVASPRPPAAMTSPVENTDANNQAVRTQRARGRERIEDSSLEQHPKGRKDAKRERDEEQKAGKRDRHNGRHRNRP